MSNRDTTPNTNFTLNTSFDAKLQELLQLSHDLGDPIHDWAILGEGNTSTRVDDETFLVKASGSELRTLTGEQVSRVRFAPVLEALNQTRDYSDAEVKDLLLSACVGGQGRMPSVETLLHGFLLTLPGIDFIGHTHVVSVNGLLCSREGWAAIQGGGRLFPDEIVVCGVAPCCVPYTDPGIPLARALRDGVQDYIQAHSAAPKTIYLQNHGFIAVGKSAQEVHNIHMMGDKAARILLGALSCGTASCLTPENVTRIQTRPDEHYRQLALGLRPDQPA